MPPSPSPALRPGPIEGPLGLPWPRIVAWIGIAWVASVCFPLLTYTTTLAAFGLTHVVQELRYLQRRFGPWLSGALPALAIALAGVVAIRLGRWSGVLERDLGLRLELVAVVGVLFAVVRWGWRPGATAAGGLGVGVALVAGLVWAPVPTLLAAAVLHNWTPVPLIAEALPPGPRRTFLAGAVGGFVVLPALIASGVPWAILGAFGAADLRILPSGSLAANLPAYLPVAWRSFGWAQHLFSAIVFAQCLHYIAVIEVMPRLVPATVGRIRWGGGPRGGQRGRCSRPTPGTSGEARTAYGVVAAIHAWVEVPILVLLLSPRAAPVVR